MELPILPVFAYKLSDLVLAEKNANVMDADRYSLLVVSIRKFGFLQPVIVEPLGDGRARVIDGHHRIRAVAELGYDNITAVHGTEAEAPTLSRALALAMNRLRGELNLSAVADELDALARAGWTDIEMQVTGFNTIEINDLLAAARVAPDELDGAAGIMNPPGDEMEESKAFPLEILFTDRKALSKAKRLLKKAAGGGTLADGLNNVLAEWQGN